MLTHCEACRTSVLAHYKPNKRVLTCYTENMGRVLTRYVAYRVSVLTSWKVYIELSVRREKNQHDATMRCLLSTSVSTCFGHHYYHLQENKHYLFADDTSFIISRPIMDLLQSDLVKIFQQIAHWFQQNSLFLNFEKTHLIQFSNKTHMTQL